MMPPAVPVCLRKYYKRMIHNMTADFLFAFATINGQTYTQDHFGSTKIYAIYAWDGKNFHHVEDIANTTEEEKADGDARKAGSVLDLLKAHGVHCVVARRFGPNIRRIRRVLLPVIVTASNISETLSSLAEAWNEIFSAYEQPPEKRQHLVVGMNETNTPNLGHKMVAYVQREQCRGCAACIPACPVEAIGVEQTWVVIDGKRCVACGACVASCPFQAIALKI